MAGRQRARSDGSSPTEGGGHCVCGGRPEIERLERKLAASERAYAGLFVTCGDFMEQLELANGKIRALVGEIRSLMSLVDERDRDAAVRIIQESRRAQFEDGERWRNERGPGLV